MPSYIVKTQPVVIDVGALRKVCVWGGIFETFDMANHLPSRLYFGFGRTTIFEKKNRQKIGRSSIADPDKGLWEEPNFKDQRSAPMSEK